MNVILRAGSFLKKQTCILLYQTPWEVLSSYVLLEHVKNNVLLEHVKNVLLEQVKNKLDSRSSQEYKETLFHLSFLSTVFIRGDLKLLQD